MENKLAGMKRRLTTQLVATSQAADMTENDTTLSQPSGQAEVPLNNISNDELLNSHASTRLLDFSHHTPTLEDTPTWALF